MLGVFFHSLWSFDAPLFTPVIFCFALFCIIIFFGPRKLFVFSWVFFGLGLGFLRFATSLEIEEARILDPFVQQSEQITLIGTIIREPIRSQEGKLNLYLQTESLVVEDSAFPVKTNIFVTSYDYKSFEFKDRIRVSGVVKKPEPFKSPSGRVFNYPAYLWKERVYYILQSQELSLIDRGKTSLKKSLYNLKNKLVAGMYTQMPEREAGLLAGVLFGQEQGLSEDNEDLFRRVGLSHIIVLSGYNIALLIVVLNFIFQFLPINLRAVVLLLGIFIFSLLVGAGPTVIRAALMGVLMVLGKVFSLPYAAGRALLVAGFCMVFLHPQLLVFDLSFQFSFLASIGLLYLSPLIEKYFTFIPKFFALRESVVTSLSAQIAVTPLLLYSIGTFSVVAPLVNMFVLWTIPFIMIIGFFMALGILYFKVAVPLFLIPSSFLLGFVFWVSELFDRLSFAQVFIPTFHWTILFILYALLTFLILYNTKK
jgi:competence protein ComEC